MGWDSDTDAAILGAQERARKEDEARLARRQADHARRVARRDLAVIRPQDAPEEEAGAHVSTPEPSQPLAAVPGPRSGSWPSPPPGGARSWQGPPAEPVDRRRALRSILTEWLENMTRDD